VSLEGLYTSPILGRRLTLGSREFPPFDRSIFTTAHEFPATRRECNTVNLTSVAVGTLETLDEAPSLGVPNRNAPKIIQSRSYESIIGGNRDAKHWIIRWDNKSVRPSFNIPESNGAVSATRCDGTSITSKIQRMYGSLVALEGIPDLLFSNIPDLYHVNTAYLELGKQEIQYIP
jgi:hypothetical protein